MAALFLTEADVEQLLTPPVALAAVEGSLGRLARGVVDNRPRLRLPLEDGQYAAMACVDRELGYAGLKSYVWTGTGTAFVVLLFALDPPTRLAAVIEADKLGQMRTGAVSAVAARHLARAGAASLGVIGCGWQAASQIACIREALPSVETVSVFCRDRRRLAEFCRAHDCEPAESATVEASPCTRSARHGSRRPATRSSAENTRRRALLSCAVGANDPAHRELDNAVLERATFVCCDSREQSRLESGDLIEPVERGVLDWLEVHELQDVVSGEIQGRVAATDIVVFKSNGLAAWDLAAAARVLELARERGVGVEL